MSKAFKCDTCGQYSDWEPHSIPEAWPAGMVNVEVGDYSVNVDFEATIKSVHADLCGDCARVLMARATVELAQRHALQEAAP